MKRGASGINCLLAIDKPIGISSHGACGRVRRALGCKRCGHAGTLDPLATGVMVVGVGQATRLMGLLTADTKSYEAAICLGSQTTTDDAEGEIIAEASLDDCLFDSDFARQTIHNLIGEHTQVPPQYSAVSVGGKRAYKVARSGGEIEIPSRTITILDAHLERIASAQPLVWDAYFKVSKGTYIRSIARDLGLELGCFAHLVGLRRLASGEVSIDDALTLDVIDQLDAESVVDVCLNPLKVLPEGVVRHIDEAELKKVIAGQALALRESEKDLDEEIPVYLVKDDKLYGIWHRQGKGLRARTNFVDGIQGAYTC